MVTIHPYNPDWPNIFQEIATPLRQTLGQSALRIDHIGSTAIPGLAAKNRIDIQVTVAALNDEILTSFLNLGFTR